MGLNRKESERDRPEPKITPAMITAGVSRYEELAGEFAQSYVVEQVFLAMVGASEESFETFRCSSKETSYASKA